MPNIRLSICKPWPIVLQGSTIRQDYITLQAGDKDKPQSKAAMDQSWLDTEDDRQK
jgi:hypothetical protein